MLAFSNLYPSHFETASTTVVLNNTFSVPRPSAPRKMNELAAEIMLLSDPAQMNHLCDTTNSKTWTLEIQ